MTVDCSVKDGLVLSQKNGNLLLTMIRCEDLAHGQLDSMIFIDGMVI